MPIAIIVTDKAIPAIIERDNDAELLSAIDQLAVTPPLESKEHARRWLALQPPPSGWYRDQQEAQQYALLAQTRALNSPVPLTPDQIRDARKALGLSRVAFGGAIGFNGNPNTINKAVHELETDPKKTLSKDKQAALFALVAAQSLVPAMGEPS